MNTFALAGALQFFLRIVLPYAGAAIAGGVVVGFLQSAVHIEDRALGFAGRAAGVVLALVLYSAATENQLVDFARQIWGSSAYYH